jgi:hypothetical protein
MRVSYFLQEMIDMIKEVDREVLAEACNLDNKGI